MNKAPRVQRQSKRALSSKVNKKHSKQRKSKKASPQTQSQRNVVVSQYSNGRVVPGLSPIFYSSTNREDNIQMQQHSRDIAQLQTHENVNLLSAMLSSNTYIPKMVLSGDLPQAQVHTRAFYRKVLRLLPGLLASYNMYELNAKSLVPVIRAQFTQHGVISSPQVLDSLRWEAEVQFADIVRLFYTETHVFATLFPDLHYAMLPKLPAAAVPEGYDPVLTKLEHQSSPFLQSFLDPSVEQRKQRSELAIPGYQAV